MVKKMIKDKQKLYVRTRFGRCSVPLQMWRVGTGCTTRHKRRARCRGAQLGSTLNFPFHFLVNSYSLMVVFSKVLEKKRYYIYVPYHFIVDWAISDLPVDCDPKKYETLKHS